MKKTSIIAILVAAILVSGILIAGCTQDAGTSGSNPSDNSQQYTQPNGGNSPPGDQGSQNSRYAGNTNGSAGSRQFRGQNILANETLISAAAGKLGLSEQDLKNALNSTTNTTSGRPNFTAAAQQLGVTQQQLMDAFGFPAGGFRGRGNVSATPAANP